MRWLLGMGKILLTATVCLALPLCGAGAIAGQKTQSSVTDLTARYVKLTAGTAPLPVDQALSAYKILFVPGFLSNFYDLRYAGVNKQLYFTAQLTDLRKAGLQAELVPTNGAAAPEENAGLIRAAITAADRPVIIIAHSKGGIDTLEALLSDKAVRLKVKGFIAVQTPFFGSEIADAILSHAALSVKAESLLKKMGGGKNALASLGTTRRRAYYRARKKEIDKLASSLPVITFATRLDGTTPLKPLRDFLRNRGLESDGLVPVSSTMLPGARHITVADCDHAMTVFQLPYGSFDKVKMTRALLSLELELMHLKQAPIFDKQPGIRIP